MTACKRFETKMETRGRPAESVLFAVPFSVMLSVMLSVLALVFLSPNPAFSQEPRTESIEVRVLPLAEVDGVEFTLGEVAELDGFDVARVQELARLSLGKSPLAGRSLRLNEAIIRSRLARAISMDGVSISVPADARVVRSSQVIKGEEVTAMVLEAANRRALQEAGAKAGIEQELLTPVKEVVLPRGAVEWKVEPLGKKAAPGGTRSYRVEAWLDGEMAWRSVIRVGQSVFQRIVVAKNPIRRNQVIGPNDVALERTDVGRHKGETFLMDMGLVVGSKARRPIGPGEWVHSGMVETPMDIAEGSKVQLVYQTEFLNFQVPGVALTAGRQGDFIPVRNLQSGRIVYGTVQPGEMVRIN
ncbi:MAG: flagellar basal body P-ring formation chaperone FlgA [Deltaproteobacteria bacterium]|nr:flagellar basal body P-ring formation chaperone FlgA [Deltaproteobacteria bacterium]